MPKQLQINLYDPETSRWTVMPILETSDNLDIDLARKTAKKVIADMGYVLRSLNTVHKDLLIAYVEPVKQKVPKTSKLDGWVFQRPSLPATTPNHSRVVPTK